MDTYTQTYPPEVWQHIVNHNPCCDHRSLTAIQWRDVGKPDIYANMFSSYVLIFLGTCYAVKSWEVGVLV